MWAPRDFCYKLHCCTIHKRELVVGTQSPYETDSGVIDPLSNHLGIALGTDITIGIQRYCSDGKVLIHVQRRCLIWYYCYRTTIPTLTALNSNSNSSYENNLNFFNGRQRPPVRKIFALKFNELST